MNQTERMKELVELLNKAGRAYYQEDREIISNYEYDKLYDELEALEEETGITLAGSPTVSVGYEAVNALPKETHETPMLSLDKTKEIEVLKNFVGNQKTVLSWKMDGLTIVLTYQDGKLKKAVTRGNGIVGEVITNNAKVFKNVPLQIAYQGELILRGEAIISYSDFEKINKQIEDVDAKYKNPRNLCSGSVRQLNGAKRRGLILWNIVWWTAKIWKKQYSIFQIKFPQMIFRPMDWWHYTMILLMEILSEVPQSFQEMLLLLNGKMKSVRQR